MSYKTLIPFLFAALIATPVSANCPDILQFKTERLRSSETVDFCQRFKGKVLLVVNTASQCGFTKQFTGLETLYQKYKGKGFAVIGFPSNDFRQEFKQESKTAEVCYLNYGVTFTMVSTSSVRGKHANPLFKNLALQTGQQPGWNFNKYLINQEGEVLEHFGSRTKPLGSVLEQKIVDTLRF